MGQVGVTGASGFIGANLMVRLGELGIPATRLPHNLADAALAEALSGVDFVIHLAGVNRPPDPSQFADGNAGFTSRLCAALAATGRAVPLVFASSIQAVRETPYGLSKRQAEEVITAYGEATGAQTAILRLPNVFGKWCRSDYNSVVATFCHNIARNLPIRIDDPATSLRLLYVDDLVDHLIGLVANGLPADPANQPGPVYEIRLDELAACLMAFRSSRETLLTGHVGTGLPRALHATYLSYLDPADFAYPLKVHSDPRGSFAEMLRTPDSGQVSFFTAHPGVTRGGHYHHSKTEKFLVVQGRARFGFRHILTGETAELVTDAGIPRIVETVPGWAHDVTNVGEGTLVVMLWANERFDPARPDTVAAPLR